MNRQLLGTWTKLDLTDRPILRARTAFQRDCDQPSVPAFRRRAGNEPRLTGAPVQDAMTNLQRKHDTESCNLYDRVVKLQENAIY